MAKKSKKGTAYFLPVNFPSIHLQDNKTPFMTIPSDQQHFAFGGNYDENGNPTTPQNNEDANLGGGNGQGGNNQQGMKGSQFLSGLNGAGPGTYIGSWINSKTTRDDGTQSELNGRAAGYWEGTSKGAQMGSSAGPWGMLIGAGIGGLVGGISGAANTKKKNKEIYDQKRIDDQSLQQNVVANPYARAYGGPIGAPSKRSAQQWNQEYESKGWVADPRFSSSTGYKTYYDPKALSINPSANHESGYEVKGLIPGAVDQFGLPSTNYHHSYESPAVNTQINTQMTQTPAKVLDPTKQIGYNGMLPPVTEHYGAGGPIHIKKSHEGKFTAYKKRTGQTTEEALHSSNPHVRKMANFAKNAAKWKHGDGGPLMDGYNNYEGNSHENGGIPIGDKAEVEGGEVNYKDYIYSDRLSPFGRKSTFAEIAKRIRSKYKDREGDSYAKTAMEQELGKLAQQNDQVRKYNEASEKIKAQQQDLEDVKKYGGYIKYENGGFHIGEHQHKELVRISRKRGVDHNEFLTNLYTNTQQYLAGGNLPQQSPGTQRQMNKSLDNNYMANQDQLGLITHYDKGGNRNQPNPNVTLIPDLNSGTHYADFDIIKSQENLRAKKLRDHYNYISKTGMSDEEFHEKFPNQKAGEQADFRYYNTPGIKRGIEFANGGPQLPGFNWGPIEDASGQTVNPQGDNAQAFQQYLGQTQEPQINAKMNENGADTYQGKAGAIPFQDANGNKFHWGPEETSLLMSNLPAFYNLAQGLKPMKTQYQRVKPETVSLSGERQMIQNEGARASRIARENARITGGSGSGATLAALAASNSAINENMMDALGKTYQEEALRNADIRNHANYTNTEIANHEIETNMQNRAMAKSLVGLGLSDIANNSQGYLRDKNMKDANQSMNSRQLQIINQMFPNYQWGKDPNSDKLMLQYVSSVDKKQG